MKMLKLVVSGNFLTRHLRMFQLVFSGCFQRCFRYRFYAQFQLAVQIHNIGVFLPSKRRRETVETLKLFR